MSSATRIRRQVAALGPRRRGARIPEALRREKEHGSGRIRLIGCFSFVAAICCKNSGIVRHMQSSSRLRQRVTKGAGSRTNGLLMAYKLLDMAQARWRRLDGAHILPLVRTGIVFVDGIQQEGKANKPQAA